MTLAPSWYRKLQVSIIDVAVLGGETDNMCSKTSLFRGVDVISKDFRIEWIRASPMQRREALLSYLSGQMD